MGALTMLRASVTEAVQTWLERHPDALEGAGGGKAEIHWAPRPNGGPPKIKVHVTRYYGDEAADPEREPSRG